MSDTEAMILRRVHQWLQGNEIQAWLVGGAVRDLLLGQPGHDLDIAVAGDAVELARGLADATGGHWVLLDEATSTARVVWIDQDTEARWSVDLVRLRAPTIELDLALRDFTVNALAIPLAQVVDGWTKDDVLDPTGGLADLAFGVVRACSAQALLDDPLRMLRAIRIAAQFGFALHDTLRADLLAQHSHILDVAAERVRDELLRLLALPHAAASLQLLDDVQLLTTIIPELEPARHCLQPGGFHYLPVLGHMLEAVRVWEWLEATALCSQPVLAKAWPLAVQSYPQLHTELGYGELLTNRMTELIDGVPRRALFKLALLMHDIAKPQTKAIKPDGSASFHDHQVIGAEIAWAVARRLRLSRAGCDYIRVVVREHMRPGQLAELGSELTRRAIYRFFTDTEAAGPDVLLHLLCDYMAVRGPRLKPERWLATVAWVDGMLEQLYATPETVQPPRIIDGRQLMAALELAPGPTVGMLLSAIREEQAVGEIQTAEQAVDLARRLLQKGEEAREQQA